MTLEKLQISNNYFANHAVASNSMYREGNAVQLILIQCTGRGTVLNNFIFYVQGENNTIHFNSMYSKGSVEQYITL